MRKIDRKLNLQKVNVLTEQRYLESKGLIKENFELAKQYCIPEDYMWEQYFKNLLKK